VKVSFYNRIFNFLENNASAKIKARALRWLFPACHNWRKQYGSPKSRAEMTDLLTVSFHFLSRLRKTGLIGLNWRSAVKKHSVEGSSVLNELEIATLKKKATWYILSSLYRLIALLWIKLSHSQNLVWFGTMYCYIPGSQTVF